MCCRPGPGSEGPHRRMARMVAACVPWGAGQGRTSGGVFNIVFCGSGDVILCCAYNTMICL